MADVATALVVAVAVDEAAEAKEFKLEFVLLVLLLLLFDALCPPRLRLADFS